MAFCILLPQSRISKADEEWTFSLGRVAPGSLPTGMLPGPSVLPPTTNHGKQRRPPHLKSWPVVVSSFFAQWTKRSEIRPHQS